MSLEWIDTFDRYIDKTKSKIAADLSDSAYQREIEGVKGDLQKDLSKNAAKLSFDLAALGASILCALTVATGLFDQIKKNKDSIQLSSAVPNLYRLVDLWGEGVAIKAGLAEIIVGATSDPKMPSDSLSARADAMLTCTRDLLLNSWKDASNIPGFDRYAMQFAAALKSVSEPQWKGISGAVESRLDQLQT